MNWYTTIKNAISQTPFKVGTQYGSQDLVGRVATDDLEGVSQWLDKKVEQLTFEYAEVPLERVKTQIFEMQDSYNEFPEDELRTDDIHKLINKGQPSFPVFIKKDDPSMFIMEGRHRVVAFMRAGYQKIPCFLVS